MSWRGRIRAFWRDFRWPVLGAFWIGALALGIAGVRRQFAALGEPRGWTDVVYRTLQLFVMEDSVAVSPPTAPWQLEVARLLAPAVLGSTALAALAAALGEQFQLFRLRFVRRHAVVCGLGDKGTRLAEDLLARGERVVAIEADAANASVRRCRDGGAIVLVGRATDESVLQRARAHRARYVFGLCRDDSTNLELAAKLGELVRRRAPRRRGAPRGTACHIHIGRRELRFVFGKGGGAAGRESPLDVRPFDVLENGARALLALYPPDLYAGPRTDGPVHVVVAGFGRFGQDLVLQVARLGHYACRKKPRITVVDADAEAKGKLFRVRHPQIELACDLTFVQLAPDVPEFQEGKFLGPGDRDDPSSLGAVYVCLEDDSLALSSAVGLLPAVAGVSAPVVACLGGDVALARLLQGPRPGGSPSGDLEVFNLVDRTCTRGVIVGEELDLRARAAHEDYVQARKDEGTYKAAKPSHQPWERLEEGYRDANRQQADHIPVKLRAVGCRSVPAGGPGPEGASFAFTTEEELLLAEMEHARWRGERWVAGWTLGPDDPARKTNPNLVEWDKLSDDVKKYDREAVRKIPRMLALTGRRVVRDAGANA